MSSTGQVALVDASSGLPANVVWLSGLPISGDRVCISNKPVSVVSSGIPYDSAGAVAATVAPITTNATLDLVFAGVSNDLLSLTSYTLTTDFITPQYQIGAQYTVWDNGLVQKNFADVVTFTRASTGTYFNSAGTLTTAAINEARFDYNPSTLAAEGLLIEESRTNSIRNNTMVGAAAGTPGTAPTNWVVATNPDGLAREIVGTGIQNGINYLDIRWSGTSGAGGTVTISNFDLNNVIAAANGQTWTTSFYVALVGGSLTNISTLTLGTRFNDNTGAQVTTGTTSVLTLTSSLSRFAVSTTATDATTAFVNGALVANFVNSSAVDFTLRIGLPQLEQGAFATSVIPTTTTALTRSADVASVNTLSPWLNQTEGTLFAEFTARLNVTQTPVTFSGAAGVGYRIRKSGTNQYYAALRDGAPKDIAITPSPALTEGQIIKVAIGVKVNDCALSGGGQAVATQTSFSPMPTITDVNLGFTATDGFALNGWFRRFTYYPRRLANADLQAITA